MNKKCSIWFK